MHEEPPNAALPQSVFKFKPDDWQPPGHDPANWHPPAVALRRFARRQASEDHRAFLPLFRCGRANWLSLSTLLLEDDWLLEELSQEEADEAIFTITADAPHGWKSVRGLS